MRNMIVLSLDEVNRFQAEETAFQNGWQSICLRPNELARVLVADAVVCDWDYLPRSERRQVMNWLANVADAVPVVVKGYQIEPEEADLLTALGTTVQMGWSDGWFEEMKFDRRPEHRPTVNSCNTTSAAVFDAEPNHMLFGKTDALLAAR